MRYPVKSMSSETLESVDVDWNGLAGDRRWAFVRQALVRNGFPWLTIRQMPEMLRYTPWFVDPHKPDTSVTMVRTPAGDELDVVDPQLAAMLSEDVYVIRQTRGIFDTMPLSLISTRTVDAIGAMTNMSLEAKRFRPNIVIDPVEQTDFAEDELVGNVIRIGRMKMRVDNRDKRCVVVNVDPDTIEKNPSVLKTITDDRQSCLGVYGTTVEPGRVSVGDAVTIES
jgi:uncharacterized protein